MFRNLLLVGFGGALGSMARYGFGLFMSSLKIGSFPFSTLIINVFGSFIIGLIAGSAYRHPWVNTSLWLFLATGICGGFTTFSAFSLENVRLFEQGHSIQAMFYIILSIVAGIIACYTGYLATH